jgi:hypothetical protein
MTYRMGIAGFGNWRMCLFIFMEIGFVELQKPIHSLKLPLSKGPNRVSSFPHLKTETDPVSETLFSSYLEFRKMDKVQKHSDSEC